MKNGIFFNLQTRIFTDLLKSYSSIEVDENSYEANSNWNSYIRDKLEILNFDKSKLFVIVLSKVLDSDAAELLSTLDEFINNKAMSLNGEPVSLYGIHFNEIETKGELMIGSIPVTCFEGNEDRVNIIYQIPVLIYMIHLSLGENALLTELSNKGNHVQ